MRGADGAGNGNAPMSRRVHLIARAGYFILSSVALIAWGMSYGVGQALGYSPRQGDAFVITLNRGVVVFTRGSGSEARAGGILLIYCTDPGSVPLARQYVWPFESDVHPATGFLLQCVIVRSREWEFGHDSDRVAWQRAGFSRTRGLVGFSDGRTAIYADDWSVPAWAIAIAVAAGAVPPFTWFQRHRRVSQRKANRLCVACGYDVRGIRERCPECGTPVPGRETPGVAASTTM